MLKTRRAIESDVPMILVMLQESAAYQANPEQICVDEQSLLRDGFGPSARYQAFVAEWNGELAGLALLVPTYSTWTKSNVIHLEDLYVREKFRRHGAGRALMAAAAAVAAQLDGRMQWFVMRENLPAIRFYESVKATISKDWMLMSLAASPLEELAKSTG